MKKAWVVTVTLLITFFLGACAGVESSSFPPTVLATQTPTSSLTPLPTFQIITSSPFTAVTSIYISPTPSSTVTATPTLDYAALGLPSPTATPTFDYDFLSSLYLTPFTPPPTRTGLPSLTPTANVPNMLSNVVIRKASPQPPPVRKMMSDNNGVYLGFYQNEAEWVLAYIQSATDLMNYVDVDRELYLQYIESWVPTALKYSPDDWFLENDFDNDGQAEWLVSIPVRFEPDGMDRCGWLSHFGYCPRFFFIFEKIDNLYYPMYVFKPAQWYFSEARVSFVDDLNNDNVKEIVFRADPCGAAVCSTNLYIGKWNGQNWESHGYISNDYAQVTFADLDGNGTIEITVAYPTYGASRYNSPYSRRDIVDIYGWKNDHYEIMDQIYPPTDSVFEIVWDINRVLAYKNTELAFEYAKPVMENLDESCNRAKTFVGIQTMLIYGLQDDAQSMQFTLAKLEKYCNRPNNAYIHAARILWLAYEKTHDPVRACLAMDRFFSNEYNVENFRWTELYLLEDRLAYRPTCPFE